MGLHEEVLPIGDHRREKTFRERLVGPEVVVQERGFSEWWRGAS